MLKIKTRKKQMLTEKIFELLTFINNILTEEYESFIAINERTKTLGLHIVKYTEEGAFITIIDLNDDCFENIENFTKSIKTLINEINVESLKGKNSQGFIPYDEHYDKPKKPH